MYQIYEQNGKLVKRPFHSFPAFELRGYDDDDIVQVSSLELNTYTRGEPLMIPPGVVMTTGGGSDVFITDDIGYIVKRRINAEYARSYGEVQ